jgi:type I restriction enzyme R subunit
MIIDHLTSSGRLEPELLYAPPFTDRAPNGVSDVFDGAAVEAILDLLEEMNPRLAASV